VATVFSASDENIEIKEEYRKKEQNTEKKDSTASRRRTGYISRDQKTEQVDII
jgi:hypothetical protein